MNAICNKLVFKQKYSVVFERIYVQFCTFVFQERRYHECSSLADVIGMLLLY